MLPGRSWMIWKMYDLLLFFTREDYTDVVCAAVSGDVVQKDIKRLQQDPLSTRARRAEALCGQM